MMLVTVGLIEVAGRAPPVLEWGVEVGDELTYILQKKTLDPSASSEVEEYIPFINMLEVGRRMVARVDFLGAIPEPTNESWSMPLSNCTLIRENDSEVMTENMSMIVIPLNVWHLNSGQFNMTYGEGYSLVNTTQQFGSVYEGQFWAGILLVSVSFEMTYSKADGALDKMMMKAEVYWSEVVNVLIMRWIPGTTMPSSTTEATDSGWIGFALVGVALGVIVALAIVTAMRLRRHRSG
jgi:hypothetical protein